MIHYKSFLRLLFCFLIGCLATPAFALNADEVLVIANRNAAKSVGLAKYYMKKRNIPAKNLLMVWISDNESCSREDYEKKIKTPVRRYLEKEENRQIRCIVSMFGMPLKINSREPSQQEGKTNSNASVDSELTLVRKDDYPLDKWVLNPYYLGFKDRWTGTARSEVLMTCRLDGPTEQVVKRVIDDSIQAEKDGLRGVAYFDARWKDPGDQTVTGYALYDRSIHMAADFLEMENRISVTKEDTEDLFQPGDCPQAVLYCGWYRLANYLDAFDWQPGSVGYHIASQECQSLKRGNYWCVKMLEDGICATIGPVAEPYVQSFPVPEIFFKYLTQGYLTLAEAYIISLPYLSWQMVLVGDPLYRMNIAKQ